jgi:hypothetical protein
VEQDYLHLLQVQQLPAQAVVAVQMVMATAVQVVQVAVVLEVVHRVLEQMEL